MDFGLPNPLGSLPFAPLPHVNTPAEDAAQRNEILLHQHMLDDAAAARAKAIADNEALLRKGQVDDAIAERGKGSFGEQAAALGRSSAEGAFGLADLPEIVGAGIKNLPTWLSNANAFGTRILPDPQPLVTPNTPVTDAFNQENPPDPRYPGTRTVGNILGGVAVTAPFGIGSAVADAAAAGRSAIPAIVKTLAVKPAVNTGLMLGGSEAGAAALPAIGDYTHRMMTGGGLFHPELGEPLNPDAQDLLRTYGNIAGGAAAGEVGPLATKGGYEALNKLFTDQAGAGGVETSARRLADADTLSAILGRRVPISLGWLGNKLAGGIEDFTSAIPWGGGPAYRARRAQRATMDEAHAALADRMRGLPPGQWPPDIGQPIDPAGIGSNVIDAAQLAHDRIQAGIDDIYDNGLHGQSFPNPVSGQPSLFSRDTAVDVAPQRALIDQLRRDPATNQARQRATIDRWAHDLQVSSNQVVDPAIEQRLDASRTFLMNQPRLPGGAVDPQVQAGLDRIEQQRLLNRGPSFQAERHARAVGVRDDPQFPLDNSIWQTMRQAKSAGMRDAALRSGVPASVYDAADQRASVLMRQRDAISDIAPDQKGNRPSEGAAYSSLLGGSGAGESGVGNLSQITAMTEHAPNEMRPIVAKQYEMKTRGPIAAGQPGSSAETMDPKKSSDWWITQRNPTVQRAFTGGDPDIVAGTSALHNLERADIRRPTRTVPGPGGNTLNSPATFFQNPLIISALGKLITGASGAGGVAGAMHFLPAIFGPAGAALGAVPSIAANVVGRRFTNPVFVRRVIHPPNLTHTPADLARVFTGAATSSPAQNRQGR